MSFLDGEFDDGCNDYDETNEYIPDDFHCEEESENYDDDDDPFFDDFN